MSRKQVQSGSARWRGRSRAGCLAGYTPGYGLKPDDDPLVTLYRAPGAFVVGLERLLLYRQG